MYVICVTGTPGTGKTTFSKRLAAHFKWEFFDVTAFIAENSLSEGFDEARNCDIIDENRLSKALQSKIAEMSKNGRFSGLVVDSHMAHYLPSELVDLCVVMKIGLKTLKNRLLGRGYGESKVQENLESEIFDVCYNEAFEAGHTILVVETTRVRYYYSEVAEILGL